jgi:hypothetical protein
MRIARAHVAALAAVSLCVALIARPAAAGAQAAQGQAPPPGARVQTTRTSPDELDRIRQAVNREPVFKLNESQVRFYLQVIAPKPDFSDFVKGQDLQHGVVAGAPMTHREFLEMVTPKELYSAAGIRPGEALQMAITGLVGQMLVRRAFESITDSWRARQIRELNERIDRELAAIRARDKAPQY